MRGSALASRVRVGLSLFLTLCLVSSSAAAGKLNRASKQARSSSGSNSSSSKSSSHGFDDDDDDSIEAALGELFFLILVLPWSLPHYAVESEREAGAWERVGFQDYPYADRSRGHLKEGDPGVALQLSADSGVDVGGDVWRHGVGLRLQLPLRLDLEADWSTFLEYGEKTDQLTLGRELLALRFAEGESIQFRTGIGPRHLYDDEGWLHGFDVLYGFDLFPGSPVVFSADGSLGSIGHAFSPGVRASLGFLLGRWELRAGWDQRFIGDVSLGGPALGVRVWL